MSINSMNLNLVKELKEFKNYQYANEYIALGWVLISTHIVDVGHPIGRHQSTVYCLAWLQEISPQHPEEKNEVYSRDSEWPPF